MAVLNCIGRPTTTQTIGYDATVPVTNAFGAETYYIRLVANTSCHFHIYDTTGSATATTADPLLQQMWETIVAVSPGQKISAIKAASQGAITATAGTLWVTELT